VPAKPPSAEDRNPLNESVARMASPDPQKSPHFGEIVSDPGTPSELLNGSNGGLRIPISDDSGFYGYNDEKHIQHVRHTSLAFSLSAETKTSMQMGEKLIVQRRGSTHSDGGRAAFKSGLAMTSVTSIVETNVPSSPTLKEEELKSEGDTGHAAPPAPGSSAGAS
jgi:hypothetical protein